MGMLVCNSAIKEATWWRITSICGVIQGSQAHLIEVNRHLQVRWDTIQGAVHRTHRTITIMDMLKVGAITAAVAIAQKLRFLSINNMVMLAAVIQIRVEMAVLAYSRTAIMATINSICNSSKGWTQVGIITLRTRHQCALIRMSWFRAVSTTGLRTLRITATYRHSTSITPNTYKTHQSISNAIYHLFDVFEVKTSKKNKTNSIQSETEKTKEDGQKRVNICGNQDFASLWLAEHHHQHNHGKIEYRNRRTYLTKKK